MALRIKLPISFHHEDIELEDPPEHAENNPPEMPQVQAPDEATANIQSQTLADQSQPQLQTNSITPPAPVNTPAKTTGASGIKLPETELDPALFKNLSSVLQSPPLMSSYPPSTKRRILAAIAGFGAGASGGPEAGAKAAQDVNYAPYNRAYQDFLTKSGALEKGVGLEAQLRSASVKGLGGVAQLINADNRGNVSLQGDLATAKEDAKKSPKTRDFEYYNSLNPTEKDAYEKYLLNTQRPGVERISGQMLTTDDAKFLKSTVNKEFKDRAGNIIPVDQLPSNMGLSLISGGTPGDSRYEVVTQPTRNVTQGNITSVIPSRSPTSPITAGLARTGETRQELGVDQQGNPATQNLTTTPVTTGNITVNPPPRVTQPNNQSNTTIPQVQNPNKPILPISQNQQPIQQQNQTTQQQNNNGRAFKPGVFSPAEIKRQTEKVAPISAAMSQLVGSTKYPDATSLRSYSDLADDAEARKRIGTVVNMIQDGMTNGGGGEVVGANALGYGASASLGGLFSWLKNSTGITAGIAKGKVTAINDALSKLNDKEKDYVNQLFASYGSMGGFRQALGMPAYKWSFDSLKREIPAIGVSDVDNSRTYNNKLAKLGVEIMEGISNSGISDQLLPQKEFWDKSTKDLVKAGNTAPPKKSRYKVEEIP